MRIREPVDPHRLAEALEAVAPRFPSFQYRLKAGFFWYSLVQDKTPARVYPESASPCVPFRQKIRGLFRVRWYGRRIAVEFSHALTDGAGALQFLKALVAEYLALLGHPSDDPDDLRRVRSAPDPAEAADDFQSLYDPTFPRYTTWDPAYQPRTRLLPMGAYAVTTGRMPLDALLAAAKAKSVSLTEYLAATLLAAFQESFQGLPALEQRRRARPVRLVIPVNLRPIFGSRTLRNFFVVVPVEIDLRLGTYDFDEILHRVHHQMQAEMAPKLLKKQIVRNLRGELRLLSRMLPLPLKGLVLRSVFGAYERRHTASLSNLGRAIWPEGWAEQLDDAEFVPPPSPYCRVNVGVVSLGATLSVTFGNLSDDRSVERAFFTRLRKGGFPIRIESNRPTLEVP